MNSHTEEQYLQSAKCRLKTQAVCKTFQQNEDTFNANVAICQRSISQKYIELFSNFNTPFSEKNFSRFTSHFSLKHSHLMRGEVGNKRNKAAFTLAEVLITLGIIGVVAAITLPNIINNYKAKQLEIAFKKSNNAITTALNATMLEYGVSSLSFKELCSGYTTVSDCNSANKETYFRDINNYFLSRFNIVRSTSDTFGNYLDKRIIRVYNFMGNRITDYGGLYGMGSFNTPWNSVNFLNDGSVVSALTFFYHEGSDGVSFTFDTNGPFRGPNRLGYDIFIVTTGTWYKPCSKKDEGLQRGIYDGRGCYEYAIKDVNPDDKTKSYWKSLYD